MPVRRALGAGLLTLGLVACSKSGSQPAPATPTTMVPAESGFRYDAATGKCHDAAGTEGYNAPDPAVLFAHFDEGTNTYAAADAECVDFTGFDFEPHIGLSYRVLDGWNFRGARFQDARFSFARMTAVDLAGADLRGLNWGYTTIEGKGDAFTQGDTCAPGEHYAVDCMR